MLSVKKQKPVQIHHEYYKITITINFAFFPNAANVSAEKNLTEEDQRQ